MVGKKNVGAGALKGPLGTGYENEERIKEPWEAGCGREKLRGRNERG